MYTVIRTNRLAAARLLLA